MIKRLYPIIALIVTSSYAVAEDIPSRVSTLEVQVTELSSRIQKLEGKGDKAWSCLANCTFYSFNEATNTIKQEGVPTQISSNGPTSLEAWKNIQSACEEARLSKKHDRANVTRVNSYEVADWKSACQKN